MDASKGDKPVAEKVRVMCIFYPGELCRPEGRVLRRDTIKGPPQFLIHSFSFERYLSFEHLCELVNYGTLFGNDDTDWV